MVMRVLALTKMVEPSLPLSQRIRATSRQLPRPMFSFRGIQRDVKRPSARMCRCSWEGWALFLAICPGKTPNPLGGRNWPAHPSPLHARAIPPNWSREHMPEWQRIHDRYEAKAA